MPNFRRDWAKICRGFTIHERGVGMPSRNAVQEKSAPTLRGVEAPECFRPLRKVTLVDGHSLCGGRNTVGDDYEARRSGSDGGRNVELSRHDGGSSGNAHGAEGVRLAIPHSAGGIGDAHQRPVRSRLIVIAVSRAQGQAVKLGSADHVVGFAVGKSSAYRSDLRGPRSLRGARRSVDLYGRREVGVENLARRQDYHIADVGAVDRRIDWFSSRIQGGAVPLIHFDASAENSLAGVEQNIAIGQQRGWTIGDVETGSEVRTLRPGGRSSVVNRSVTGCAAIRASGENRAIGT